MDKATKTEQKRTLRQNRALHKYLTLVAHELQNQGQTLQDVVKKISFAEITPTTQSLKEVMWRPIQQTAIGKDSTTELTTAEIKQVYDLVSMFLSKQFEIDLPWPSEEDDINYLKSFEN